MGQVQSIFTVSSREGNVPKEDTARVMHRIAMGGDDGRRAFLRLWITSAIMSDFVTAKALYDDVLPKIWERAGSDRQQQLAPGPARGTTSLFAAGQTERARSVGATSRAPRAQRSGTKCRIHFAAGGFPPAGLIPKYE